MIKEYILKATDMEHDKRLVKALKKIAKEAQAEYYTKVIDKRYMMGQIVKGKKKHRQDYWEVKDA